MCFFICGRFYKDDSHSAFWGEEKYSGGHDGSSKNFPGVGGVSALVIPASRFVVHFHSDGSNNEWGYKITITATSASSVIASGGRSGSSFGFDTVRGKLDGFSFSEEDKVAVSPSGPKLLYSGMAVGRGGGAGVSALLEWNLRDLDGNAAWGVGFLPGGEEESRAIPNS